MSAWRESRDPGWAQDIGYQLQDFRHVLGSYWCYKSGPQHAKPFLIEERP